NVTGVTLLTSLMEPKRLGLLRDLVPGVALIGVLINPGFPPAALQLQQIEEAARAIGQRIVITKASNDDALEAAFRSLVQAGVGALLVDRQTFVGELVEQIRYLRPSWVRSSTKS